MSAKLQPQLVGRTEELAELRRLLYAPASQNVAFILLSGEEGIGKSSILRASTHDAREHGFMVLEGKPKAVELPPPFSLLHELLNSLATQRRRSLAALGFNRSVGKDRAALPMGLVPVGTSLESPEKREERLLAALSGKEMLPVSGRESNREEKEQDLFDQLTDHLDEVATEENVLIAIDDLHYADQASMDFLRYLSRRTRGKKMKIMATCRPDPEVPEMVRSILNDIGHEGLLHSLEVRRLTEVESQELLKQISQGRLIPPATMREWYTTSRGNPLALEQLLRGGMTSADFSREGSVRTSAVFAKLNEEDKSILSYASVIGKSFSFRSLYLMVGGDEEKLAEGVDSLIHHGTLEERGTETYEFSNEQLWRSIYNSMSESRRRVIHRKAAEAYEKLNPHPSPDIIPEMARHFYLGRVHEKALLYNRYAATQAIAAFSPDVAIFYLERALEDLAAMPGDHRVEEADVLKEIGEQHDAMGDGDRADEFYGKSLEKLPKEEETLRALILLSRADSAREMDKMALTHQYCEEAIQILEKLGHKKGLAMAHRSLARAAYRADKFETGQKEIEATLKLLDPEKDAKDVARCYIEMGNVHSIMPEPTELAKAIEYYQKAVETLEPLHDYHELARAHNNLAVTKMPNPREALKELLAARSYAEKAKGKRFLGWILFNSVELHLALGEEREAARNNAEARQILSKFNDQIGMEQITLNEGILAQHRKAYLDSERAYRDALKRAETLGYPKLVVEDLMHLAKMYAEWGKNDEAVKVISRIKEVGEDHIFSNYRPGYEELKKRLGA
jgi:tetratricopeptide (TPR) repeat protein